MQAAAALVVYVSSRDNDTTDDAYNSKPTRPYMYATGLTTFDMYT